MNQTDVQARQQVVKQQYAACEGMIHLHAALKVCHETHLQALATELAQLGMPQDGTTDISDALWEQIAPMLQLGTGRGRPYTDARRTFNGVRYIMQTQTPWKHLPARYGSYVTCWRRYLRWQATGAWARIQPFLIEQPATDAVR